MENHLGFFQMKVNCHFGLGTADELLNRNLKRNPTDAAELDLGFRLFSCQIKYIGYHQHRQLLQMRNMIISFLLLFVS